MARSVSSKPGPDVPVTAGPPAPVDVDERVDSPAGGDVQAVTADAPAPVDERVAGDDNPAAGAVPVVDVAAPVVDLDELAGLARQRVLDAEAALALAREQAGARLPGGGYVIATERLYVPGGARAHNPGDRVPVGNVEANGWQAQVRPPADGE
jgi:hypothetical protein